MDNWKITPLVFGTIDVKKEQLTTCLDVGFPIKVPYLGFYLTNGEERVLVDNGINSKYIVDGKAWAGSPAVGGEELVLKALASAGLEPGDIDTVIYTHLHNDHAGNCHLFPDATHIFQEAEWKELLDPLPSMRIRGDYDQTLIPELEDLTCLKVFGDTDIRDGVKLLLTPGHTAGSQCLRVNTKEGVFILAGDTVHVLPIAFPEMDTMILIDGSKLSITPAPRSWGPAVPSSLVYDHYSWFRSIYRIKSILKGPEFLLPGHEPSLVGKHFG